MTIFAVLATPAAGCNRSGWQRPPELSALRPTPSTQHGLPSHALYEEEAGIKAMKQCLTDFMALLDDSEREALFPSSITGCGFLESLSRPVSASQPVQVRLHI
ncbi:hypothetical protein FRB91_004072 [Serendipita sp. 411]|nr:hypothetical protein FRC15_007178 [Serendipita sp. 397]KAG8833829.1 hypothetical protein FRC18_002998 [Serendipita sp. 400]KAG8854055.1 hypothetical protein FRB91_004072 [Serendipita sp. 411]